MVIPKDSPKPAGAQRFINFMTRPEISAQITQYIGFASGNAAALPLLDPAVRDNPDRLSAAGDPRALRRGTSVFDG